MDSFKEFFAENTATTMDGDKIKVGDFAGFKDGVEQSGKVVKISGSSVTISMWNSDEGTRYNVVKDARRIWKE